MYYKIFSPPPHPNTFGKGKCKFLCEGGGMVNQQVTLLNFNNGTPETACGITFKFNNYLNQKVQHKKINKRFLE